MVRVEIDLPKEQYDFIKENLDREKWLGSLEEFIAEAIRAKQGDIMRSGVFKLTRKADAR